LSTKFIKLFTCSLALLCAQHSVSAFAASCDDNFSVTGSFFTGKVYKTWSDLPAGKFESAYKGAYLYTLKNGWKLLTSDKEMGVFTAAQATLYASGKIVPINVAIEKSDSQTKISITYTTPAGVSSPEDAVKIDFCKTIAAAEMEQGGSSGISNQDVKNEVAIQAKNSPRLGNTKGQINLAAITSEQEERIKKETEKKFQDARLRNVIADAAPTLKEFVAKLSCLPYNGGDLNAQITSMFTIYAAPGRSLSLLPPANQTRYHDKSSCLTVVRIQGWNAPALNALKFEVVYLANDSGESAKTNHEMVKQPDGVWLFNR
jgi:hypothetical protein